MLLAKRTFRLSKDDLFRMKELSKYSERIVSGEITEEEAISRVNQKINERNRLNGITKRR